MTKRRRSTDRDDGAVMDGLRQRLLTSAQMLAAGLDEAMGEASLRERASALGTLIDRLIKLQQLARASEEASDDGTAEQVVRVEYQYPDGTPHDAPPWANADYGFHGALPSGRLREAFRQDGGGEVADS